MTVNVGVGEAWVPGSLASTQSGYYCRVSSQTALAIAAANATNPRIDTVVAVVADAAYTGATNTFALAVVTGTPTAGATLGNLNGAGSAPANALVLGYVLVPATATNIISGDILNVATVVQTISLGMSSGTLSSRPSPGHPPRGYYATDTEQYFFDASSLWITGLGLNSRTITGTTTANPGDCVIVTAGAPFTLTIPAPTPGAMIGVAVFSATGANPITLSTGTSFNGLGVNALTSIKLGTIGSNVLLVANGTTNWVILAGGQDTGFVNLTLLSVGDVPISPQMSFSTQVSYTAAVRLRGDRCEFKGRVFNPSAGATPITAATPFATVPSTFYPAFQVYLSAEVDGATTPSQLTVDAAGNIASNTNVGPGDGVSFDGLFYSKTGS